LNLARDEGSRQDNEGKEEDKNNVRFMK